MNDYKPFATARLAVKNNKTGRGWRSPKPMKIFVDSGSTMTILPPSALSILNEKVGDFESVHANIQTVNGSKEAIALKDVSFCLNASCFRGDVLVTDGIKGDVLVGSDFLTKVGCSLDFKKKTMKCRGGTIRFKMEE